MVIINFALRTNFVKLMKNLKEMKPMNLKDENLHSKYELCFEKPVLEQLHTLVCYVHKIRFMYTDSFMVVPLEAFCIKLLRNLDEDPPKLTMVNTVALLSSNEIGTSIKQKS